MKSCEIACKSNDRITFCCTDYKIQSENYKCSNEQLDIDCDFSCDIFVCDK